LLVRRVRSFIVWTLKSDRSKSILLARIQAVADRQDAGALLAVRYSEGQKSSGPILTVTM
jgi:hypothetical protein